MSPERFTPSYETLEKIVERLKTELHKKNKMVSDLQRENRQLDRDNEKLYNELRKLKGARP